MCNRILWHISFNVPINLSILMNVDRLWTGLTTAAHVMIHEDVISQVEKTDCKAWITVNMLIYQTSDSDFGLFLWLHCNVAMTTTHLIRAPINFFKINFQIIFLITLLIVQCTKCQKSVKNTPELTYSTFLFCLTN